MQVFVSRDAAGAYERRNRVTKGTPMELFTNQVLAGIATGAIYACMALASVRRQAASVVMRGL